MAGGGGGDGGYQKQQKEIEAKKQAARDRLNVMFGVEPSTATPSIPDSDGFYKTRQITRPRYVGGDAVGDVELTEERYFDQAAYDAAVKAAQDSAAGVKADVLKNRGARDALYGTVRENAFNAGKRRIDEQRDQARRNLKFELFARGLAGGSEDINQNALLGRTYDQGVLDLGAKADAAKTDMMANDEQTRLGLLQSIDAGMDQGSAISSALNQLRVNADRAAAGAQGTAVGDLFGGAGLLYQNSQMAKGKQAATQDWWNTYQPGRNKQNNYTGTITGV